MLLNASFDYPNVYSTLCDDYGTMFEATAEMIQAGITDILYLYDSKSYSGLKKLHGFRDAMKEHNIPGFEKLSTFTTAISNIWMRLPTLWQTLQKKGRLFMAS